MDNGLAIEPGEEISIDFAKGKIESSKGAFVCAPLPESVLRILEAGGLIPYIKMKMEREKTKGEGHA